MALSIFSWAYLSSRYLLWWSTCYNLLSFKKIMLSVFLLLNFESSLRILDTSPVPYVKLQILSPPRSLLNVSSQISCFIYHSLAPFVRLSLNYLAWHYNNHFEIKWYDEEGLLEKTLWEGRTWAKIHAKEKNIKAERRARLTRFGGKSLASSKKTSRSSWPELPEGSRMRHEMKKQ